MIGKILCLHDNDSPWLYTFLKTKIPCLWWLQADHGSLQRLRHVSYENNHILPLSGLPLTTRPPSPRDLRWEWRAGRPYEPLPHLSRRVAQVKRGEFRGMGRTENLGFICYAKKSTCCLRRCQYPFLHTFAIPMKMSHTVVLLQPQTPLDVDNTAHFV